MFSLQGGLRAVVWTDLFQGLVMIGGLVAIIVQERKNERIDGSMRWHIPKRARATRPLTAPLHRIAGANLQQMSSPLKNVLIHGRPGRRCGLRARAGSAICWGSLRNGCE